MDNQDSFVFVIPVIPPDLKAASLPDLHGPQICGSGSEGFKSDIDFDDTFVFAAPFTDGYDMLG